MINKWLQTVLLLVLIALFVKVFFTIDEPKQPKQDRTVMANLIDSAVKLYHKRQMEQMDRFFNAFEILQNTGKFQEFENTNADKIWSWACKRWKNFPYREYELRIDV